MVVDVVGSFRGSLYVERTVLQPLRRITYCESSAGSLACFGGLEEGP